MQEFKKKWDSGTQFDRMEMVSDRLDEKLNIKHHDMGFISSSFDSLDEHVRLWIISTYELKEPVQDISDSTENKILIIDIETSDFLQRGGTIVEVGIVELDIVTGQKRIVFDSIVKESKLTEEVLKKSWIVSNNYMKLEDIMSAPAIETKLQEIQEIINKYTLGSTAFNNRFDFDFLESRGIKFPKKLPCPMLLSTNICKIPGPRGFKWPKVEEAYEFYFGKTDYIELHRGADDAFHEADIVFELIKRGVFKLQ